MIKYLALLRGINISGKNLISMDDLKKEFENLEYNDCFTYLNSGNVVFSTNISDKDIIKNDIEIMIKNSFNIDIPVYITSIDDLIELLENKPSWWGNSNKEVYDNLIFLIPPITYNEVFNIIGEPNEYEKIKEYNNNIFWSFNLKNYRKSNWWKKTASTDIANSITIRTSNTIKKIIEKIG